MNSEVDFEENEVDPDAWDFTFSGGDGVLKIELFLSIYAAVIGVYALILLNRVCKRSLDNSKDVTNKLAGALEAGGLVADPEMSMYKNDPTTGKKMVNEKYVVGMIDGIWNQYDNNGDGELSIAEIKNLLTQLLESLGQKDPEDPDGESNTCKILDTLTVDQVFNKMDTSNDGLVSKDEMAAYVTKLLRESAGIEEPVEVDIFAQAPPPDSRLVARNKKEEKKKLEEKPIPIINALEMIDDTGYNENSQNADMNTIEHDTDDEQIQGLGQMSQHSGSYSDLPLPGNLSSEQSLLKSNNKRRPAKGVEEDDELNLF